MMPMFGLTAADTADPNAEKYLLAKDVEKAFDTFDRYRMYASTMRCAAVVSNRSGHRCAAARPGCCCGHRGLHHVCRT